MMRKTKLTLIILLALMTSIGSAAKGVKDFVSVFMENLQQSCDSIEVKDFNCVTVSPSMISQLRQIMSAEDESDGDVEQIPDLLTHGRSMRIFSAVRKSEKYYTEAVKLLESDKKHYKPFAGEGAQRKSTPVWVRKNGSKVVEMIVFNRTNDDQLHIVNVTGDMNKDFINLLLKM